jgi:8-oxo-dGTP pyrophosphatase MutT (NUDIX family)
MVAKYELKRKIKGFLLLSKCDQSWATETVRVPDRQQGNFNNIYRDIILLMREIQRTIVSALIFSKDGRLLMGRKDPSKGGVYPDAWHIPGGGVDDGETLLQTLEREVQEEVGIKISGCKVVPLSIKRGGSAEKTLKDTGERVLCNMEFNYFEVYVPKDASDVEIVLNDDLIEVNWFSKNELGSIAHIPGGKEFFIEMGYMSKN